MDSRDADRRSSGERPYTAPDGSEHYLYPPVALTRARVDDARMVWWYEVPIGTAIYAPEAGEVEIEWDRSPPAWAPYGATGLVLRGASGLYHILAGFDPAAWSLFPRNTEVFPPKRGTSVASGELIGRSSTKGVTWQVRAKRDPAPPELLSEIVVDPASVLSGGRRIWRPSLDVDAPAGAAPVERESSSWGWLVVVGLLGVAIVSGRRGAR